MCDFDMLTFMEDMSMGFYLLTTENAVDIRGFALLACKFEMLDGVHLPNYFMDCLRCHRHFVFSLPNSYLSSQFVRFVVQEGGG